MHARPHALGRDGRYVVVGDLGQGGMGALFLAEDRSLRRLVAVKVIRDEALADPSNQARFRREAQLLASLEHPNLVRIYEIDLEARPPYLVMERLEGEDLQQRLTRAGPLSSPEARRLAHGLAEALACLHGRQVLHRDVKPDNVFLCRDGSVRLLDLGLALPTDLTRLTGEGMMVGTPLYLPPEVLGGGEYVAASDVYQVGLVLHLALTGRQPFDGATDEQAMIERLLAGAVPPVRVAPGVPSDLAAVVRACVAPVSRRPADGRALLGLVEGTSSERRVAASPRRPAAPRPWEGGRRWPAAVVVALVAALAALAVTRGSSPSVIHGGRPPTITRAIARFGLDAVEVAWTADGRAQVEVSVENERSGERVQRRPSSSPLVFPLSGLRRADRIRWRLGLAGAVVAEGTGEPGPTLRLVPSWPPCDLSFENRLVDRPIVAGPFVVLAARPAELLAAAATGTASGTSFPVRAAAGAEELGRPDKLLALAPAGKDAVVLVGVARGSVFARRVPVPWSSPLRPDWEVSWPGSGAGASTCSLPDSRLLLAYRREDHVRVVGVSLATGATGAPQDLPGERVLAVVPSGPGAYVVVAGREGVVAHFLRCIDGALRAEEPVSLSPGRALRDDSRGPSVASVGCAGGALIAYGRMAHLVRPGVGGGPPDVRSVELPMLPESLAFAALANPDGGFLVAVASPLFAETGSFMTFGTRVRFVRLERTADVAEVGVLPLVLARLVRFCDEAGVLRHGGLIYLAFARELVVVRDAPGYDVVGQWMLPEPSDLPPCIVEGCLVFGGYEGSLIGFDLLGAR